MKNILFLVAFLLAITGVSGQGRVVYHQDFGCNDTADAEISAIPLKECHYPQNTADVSYCGSYAVRKRAFVNNNRHGDSQWYAQTDHTHPDPDRGCFLQVDCGLEHSLFYTFVVTGVPVGAVLDISLWVANLYTHYQKQAFQAKNWNIDDPDLDLLVFAADDTELQRFRIGSIAPDSALTGRADFTKSAAWVHYSFSFTLAVQTPYLMFALGNRTVSSPGNDFAIDDILVTTRR